MAEPTPIVIDRLWQGVAGTAPWNRRAGQVEFARNVRFDLRVGGATKRNATMLVRDLEEFGTGSPLLDPDKDYYIVPIRGAKVAIGQDEIHGWDEDGEPLEVIDATINPPFNDYLSDSAFDPANDIDVAVAEDTIVFSNRRTAPELAAVPSYAQIIGLITGVVGVPAPSAITYVDDFTFFPISPAPGTMYFANGASELDPAGLYIAYTGAVAADNPFPQHGPWWRIPIATDFDGYVDPATLPHRIVYDEVAGTLTVSACPWKFRISGTSATNRRMPWLNPPGSTGRHVVSLQFHQQRLFLISEAHVTSSRRDDYFNLWIDAIEATNDSDRIISNIARRNTGGLLRCGSLGEHLLLLAENGQLSWGSGREPLTNSNGRENELTDYQSEDIAPGLGAGVATFIDKSGDVHQYRWGGDDFGIIYGGMLNAHWPQALDDFTPSRIFAVGTTVFITTDEGELLVQDSYFNAGQMVQSAFSQFDTYEPVVFVAAWAGQIHLITRTDATAGGSYALLHHLHRRAIAPNDDLLYLPHLDRMELIDGGDLVYDAASDETTVYHTERDGDEELSCAVIAEGTDVLEFISPEEVATDGGVVFSGDLTGKMFYIGFRFTTELELSKLYPTLTGNNVAMNELAVFYYASSDFKVTSTFDGRLLNDEEWQAARVSVIQAGAPLLDTHYRRFGLIGDPRLLRLLLSSEGPGTVTWMALSYDVLLQGKGGGR